MAIARNARERANFNVALYEQCFGVVVLECLEITQPMMTDAELDAIRLSLSVALRSVLVSLPFAVFVAWLLTRQRLRGRLMLDVLVHLPLVLPPVVVGYLLLLLFGVRGPLG